jgi:hypothetical protein
MRAASSRNGAAPCQRPACASAAVHARLVGRLQDPPPAASSARSGDSSARAPDVPVAGPAARRQQAGLVRRPRERLHGGGVLAEAPQRRRNAARARRPDGHRVVVAAAGQLRVAGRPLRAGAAWSGAAGVPDAGLPRCRQSPYFALPARTRTGVDHQAALATAPRSAALSSQTSADLSMQALAARPRPQTREPGRAPGARRPRRCGRTGTPRRPARARRSAGCCGPSCPTRARARPTRARPRARHAPAARAPPGPARARARRMSAQSAEQPRRQRPATRRHPAHTSAPAVRAGARRRASIA